MATPGSLVTERSRPPARLTPPDTPHPGSTAVFEAGAETRSLTVPSGPEGWSRTSLRMRGGSAEQSANHPPG